MDIRTRQQVLIALNAGLAGGIAAVVCLARRVPLPTTTVIAASVALVLWGTLAWAARQFEEK